MFKCDKCGLCCKSIGGNPFYGELDRGDGICKFLDGKLCSIYKKRPLLCRLSESYDAFFSDLMTKDQFYDLNYRACKKIKQKFKGEE